jgi:Fatty acid hydroxylase superfamily
VAGKLRCAARSARLPVRGSLSIGAQWPGHKENNPSSYKGKGAGVAPPITLFAILFHANVDWDWGPPRSVIAAPRFHRWHHTGEAEARDKNFAGLLPLWDILFGTYYMPII